MMKSFQKPLRKSSKKNKLVKLTPITPMEVYEAEVVQGKRTTNNRGRRSGQRLLQAERDARILELRILGHTYEQISDELKISTGVIGEVIEEYMTRAGTVWQESAETMRNLEIMRLEHLYKKALDRTDVAKRITDEATGKTILIEETSTKAMDTLIRIMERKSKLVGLDAADRYQPDNSKAVQRAYIGVDTDKV